MTNVAFGFCTSEKAQLKIRTELKNEAQAKGSKIANAYFVQFMNAPQTVLEYKVLFDLIDKDSKAIKMYTSFEIDAEDAGCKVLHSVAESMSTL